MKTIKDQQRHLRVSYYLQLAAEVVSWGMASWLFMMFLARCFYLNASAALYTPWMEKLLESGDVETAKEMQDQIGNTMERIFEDPNIYTASMMLVLAVINNARRRRIFK